MIKPNHNCFANAIFRGYIHHILRKNFHEIRVIGDVLEEGRSVLLLGNHFSWWDGFIAYYINNHYLNKRFHVMMLEEQLKKYPFFRYLGAFSINPYSRIMPESLNFASEILGNPDHLLLMYPQGKIESHYTFPFRFGKGVLHVIDNVPGKKPGVFFYVALIDYFSKKKPTLSLFLRNYPLPVNLDILVLEQAYNDFYKACITLQKE